MLMRQPCPQHTQMNGRRHHHTHTHGSIGTQSVVKVVCAHKVLPVWMVVVKTLEPLSSTTEQVRLF